MSVVKDKSLIKVLLAVILSLAVVTTASCASSKKVSYGSVNAEIIELTYGIKGMVVKGLDTDSILGEATYVSCESAKLLYADYATGELLDLEFEDFMVGDAVLIDIDAKYVELISDGVTVTSRVQLSTQRK